MHSLRRTCSCTLLLLALTSMMIPSSVDAARVTIENRLGDGLTFDIECASRDDYLGRHTLADGEDYWWEFINNIWGTTLFYCDISWGSGYRFHFDAYDAKRDKQKGVQFLYSWWIADQLALYHYNDASEKWEIVHFWKDAEVTIENRLGDGLSYDIHCASGDDDLGHHTIPDGEDYQWQFNPNIWGTTLFSCDISWGVGYSFHFDAFVYSRDHQRCRYGIYCWWYVNQYALYSWNEQITSWEIEHLWAT